MEPFPLTLAALGLFVVVRVVWHVRCVGARRRLAAEAQLAAASAPGPVPAAAPPAPRAASHRAPGAPRLAPARIPGQRTAGQRTSGSRHAAVRVRAGV